jgi:hypothetical protein
MLNNNLPPTWKRDSSDWLIDLALRLKALEQEQSGNPSAAIEIWHQVILLSKAKLQVLQPSHSFKASLFDQDYYTWVKEQIRLLHLRQVDQVDLEHLPDELNDLVWLIKQKIKTNLEVICNHLLKYKYAREYLNDEPCCNSWRSALFQARREIAYELKASPSLQDYPSEEFEKRYQVAMNQVYQETKLLDNTLPKSCSWTINQILDKRWLPV